MTINLKNFLSDKSKLSKMGEFQDLKPLDGLEVSSIESGDTATGSGFKLPLVISTSIKADTLNGKTIKKVISKNLTISSLYITLLTSPLHQN